MNEHFLAYFPILFPIFFVSIWLVVTTVLSLLSDWFALMRSFPDPPDPPLLWLTWQSGGMGPGVAMRSILTLSACRTGLRVAIFRVFGPFRRPFFVPWDQISVVRTTSFFMPVAKLRFGDPVVGTLTLPARVADRLARASPGTWPEPGTFPPESRSRALFWTVLGWAAGTSFAALFFIVASRAGNDPNPPPIIVLVLFPAVGFGLAALASYFRRTR